MGRTTAMNISAKAGTKRRRFQPGELWLDNHRVPINAHGGGILFHQGTYYWFGEHKIAGEAGNRAQVGIHVYTSNDLYAWDDGGIALPVTDDPAGEITRDCILERPKVIVHPRTGKFVMWFHLEPKGVGYAGARSGVAVADQPQGPYHFLGSLRPNAGVWPENVPAKLKRPLSPKELAHVNRREMPGGPRPYYPKNLIFRRDFAMGQMARDMTLFVDDDGAAYHIHAAEDNGTLHLSQLSDDYLRPAGRYLRLFPARFNEAPAMMKWRGRYFLITSDCTGWAPNPARIATADSIWGPWEELGNPCLGSGAQIANTFVWASSHLTRRENHANDLEPSTRTNMKRMDHWNNAYGLCVQKAKRNIIRLAENPKSGAWAVDGNYFTCPEGFYDIGNWTSSFFTGMALLAYETTQDRFLLQQVNQLSNVYRRKVGEYEKETMHDLGFLYSLYSVALYKLTGDTPSRSTALRAADILAKRFDLRGGYIRAWGRMDENQTDYAGLAIIDCMMNLPLLFWAAQQTGNHFYSDIAVRHADTTGKHFIRADHSVYHAYRFDVATGTPLRGDNYCGFAVDSHWARGTAWAIYGFALAYGFTQNKKYLETSSNLARRFIACLDAEVVPIWDFKLPPGQHPVRDSSAAAVAVCGFLELLKYEPGNAKLAQTADSLLSKLCSEKYLDTREDCPGVLKNAQVGDGIGKAKNAYTSWGDYFLMEALAKKQHGVAGYWVL
jgi:unsaturated chondroitin disaccharide hydrolase